MDYKRFNGDVSGISPFDFPPACRMGQAQIICAFKIQIHSSGGTQSNHSATPPPAGHLCAESA